MARINADGDIADEPAAGYDSSDGDGGSGSTSSDSTQQPVPDPDGVNDGSGYEADTDSSSDTSTSDTSTSDSTSGGSTQQPVPEPDGVDDGSGFEADTDNSSGTTDTSTSDSTNTGGNGSNSGSNTDTTQVPDPDGVNDGSGFEADAGSTSDSTSDTTDSTNIDSNNDDGTTPPVGGPPVMRDPDTGEVEDPLNREYYENAQPTGPQDLSSPGPEDELTEDVLSNIEASNSAEAAAQITEQTGLQAGSDFTIQQQDDSFVVSYTDQYQKQLAAQQLDERLGSTVVTPDDVTQTEGGQWTLTSETAQQVGEAQFARQLGVSRDEINVNTDNNRVVARSDDAARALAEYQVQQQNPNVDDVEVSEVAPGVFRATGTGTSGNVQPSGDLQDLTATVVTPTGEDTLASLDPAGSTERANEGIAARARSEGVDAEKVEVQTGRDVNDDGSVTSQQEYLTDQLTQQLDAKMDADLTSGDVKAVRTQENGETVYKGVLTDSGEQKLENQAETSSFTAKIPEGVPVAGGASVTLKGESGDANVESTASGTTTETSERSVFGEFGGWYAAAEDTATDLTTEFMAASQDAAESVEGKVSLNPMAELLLRSRGRTESAEAIRESSTAATTGVVTAPAALSQGATTAAFEGPELAYALATSEEARRRAPGAAAGMAAQSASYAADNPYEVGAQAVVTTLASGGAVTALQGTRFAGAARFAASPVGTTARQFGDVDVSSVRGAAGSARERLSNIPTPDDERGMAQLPKFGSDSDGSSGSSDSGGVAGSLSEEIGEYLGRFERGERLRNAKQRAEERFLRDQQEAAERQERGSEPTTVDTRPGGDYVADSGPGGGYTASRTPDTSRSGPTATQRRAYRSTITSDSSDSSTEAEQLLEQDDAAAELSSGETTVASLVGASGAGGLQALSDAQASQVSSEDSVTAEASQSQFLVTGDSAESAVTPQILAGIQNAQQPAVGSVGATVTGAQGSFQTTAAGTGTGQLTGIGTATGTATRTDNAADTRADTQSNSQTGNAAAPDSTPPNTPQSGRGFGFPNRFGGSGVGVQSGLESAFGLRTEASAWGTETSIRADRPDDQSQPRSEEQSLPAFGDSTPRERGAGWLNKFAVALAGGGVQARSTPQDVEQYDSQTAALPLPTEGQVDPSESLQAGLEDVDNLFFGFGGVASSESSTSSSSETSDEDGWWAGGGWL